MAKVKDLHSEMAHARKTDGLNVIFDRSSTASSRSRSRSRSSDGSNSSLSSRGRGSYRRRDRSSSSSSRSSNSRSRSHPRCHRRFSCCRCETHSRKSYRRYRKSPSRHHKVRHHSDSCSPSPNRSSRRRNGRSRSRSNCSSSRRERRNGRGEGRTEHRVSRSPSKTDRSPSLSSQRSTSLSLHDKKELLQAAKASAMKMSGSDTSNPPESVTQLSPQPPRSMWELPEEPRTWVRQGPKKTPSQSDDSDPEDTPSPKIATQRKTITFSINNSVAKPTAAAPTSARITARVDSYESRKPYGHWVPVKSGRKRKHTLAVSR